MTTSNQTAESSNFKRLLHERYTPTATYLTRKQFLKRLWSTLSDIVQHNRNHILIEGAVKRYPDLVPRSFVILSLQYGSFSADADLRNIISDFTGHLTADLDDVLEQIVQYSDNRDKNSIVFFSGLNHLWSGICEQYENIDDPKIGTMIPPTPYHAYAILALNRPDLIGLRGSCASEVERALFEHHAQMDSILSIVRARSTAVH